MSIQTLVEKIKEKGNPTVAGLDARLEYIPQHISGRNMMLHGETLRAAAESVVAFNCGLIDALCDIVPAVKPQAAYYELLGSYGAMALKETIDYAHAKGMYVIGDIKRNDIGATASAYAEAYLGKTRVGDTEIAPYGCDSVTVNGYLGTDGVEPFLKECRSREKSLFLLVKTSNPSSGELQNRDMEGKPLYARMAEMVAKWGEGLDTPCGYNQIGAVVGATYPEEQSRELVRMLSERYGRVFSHGGGGAEQAFAEEMERTYPNVTALYGKVRFAGEMDLIANLDCVVTMDSLVMHLASLVATPVVSVWGATHPGLGFLGYGVSPGNVLQADMACRHCSVFGNKPCRYGDYRCLKAVTPEMAARRVAEITGSLPECPGNG